MLTTEQARAALGVLDEVYEERKRQQLKWGEQNHHDLDQVLLNRSVGCTPKRMAEQYEIPTAKRARYMCELEHGRGPGISEEQTSELQSLMRMYIDGFCFNKIKKHDQ